MIYKLKFEKRALKEWDKLGHTLKQQLKNKLSERLDNPHVPSARLSGKTNRYKIKLRASGYRLVYEVNDNEVVLLVIAIGKRTGDDIYHAADQR
ncbi:type II toxin-antitoxin system RelE/ParE family toxin [Candidatus Regiella endosymbiont of Tuberolachnus salignus]|uniref:type II toxin-antitoxin system RelE family toxin n=1 Tax=Candidatus Regiella endosymbiont of Tuberolachnus salignus TaxID=3077956 RepID=UPI0030D195B9